MKWLLFGVAGLAALVGLMAVLGSMLPRNHKASRTLRVKRPAQDVWAAVTAATGASSVPVDVLESNPPYRQVTRVKETEKMFGGTWTIAIQPEPHPSAGSGQGGSVLTITEDGWVGNPIFRFMSKYVFGHHSTMDGILKQVAKALNEEPALSGE
jgi:hypothetical protein